jgi:succinyl-CoA synthetase beta subunit
VIPTENGFIPADCSQAILEAYGIPVLKLKLARNAEEALACFQQIGGTAAIKVASPDIPHKSDVGGVILNLEDAPSVRAGFNAVIQRARAAYPQAKIQGAYLQQMVPSGQEVIVGAVQDPQFGALVMFGSGGIEVEGLKDLAFALAPLTDPEAEYMLGSTWAGRKLRGFRNLPPADRQAVRQVLFRLAQLAADHPNLAEIEINPLRVLPAGQGVAAIDIRIRLAD